jgi:hypothetical protein
MLKRQTHPFYLTQLTDAHSLRLDESGQRVSRQQFHARVTEALQRSLGGVLPPGSSASIRVSTLDADTLQVLVVARQPAPTPPPSPRRG